MFATGMLHRIDSERTENCQDFVWEELSGFVRKNLHDVEGKILSLFVAWEGVGRSRVGLKLGKCPSTPPHLASEAPRHTPRFRKRCTKLSSQIVRDVH